MTAEYLKKVVAESTVENPSVYVVGMPGFKQELANAGLRVINMDETDNDVKIEGEDTMSESELATY